MDGVILMNLVAISLRKAVVWRALSVSLADAVAMAALLTPIRLEGFWPSSGRKKKEGKMVHARTH